MESSEGNTKDKIKEDAQVNIPLEDEVIAIKPNPITLAFLNATSNYSPVAIMAPEDIVEMQLNGTRILAGEGLVESFEGKEAGKLINPDKSINAALLYRTDCGLIRTIWKENSLVVSPLKYEQKRVDDVTPLSVYRNLADQSGTLEDLLEGTIRFGFGRTRMLVYAVLDNILGVRPSGNNHDPMFMGHTTLVILEKRKKWKHILKQTKASIIEPSENRLPDDYQTIQDAALLAKVTYDVWKNYYKQINGKETFKRLKWDGNIPKDLVHLAEGMIIVAYWHGSKDALAREYFENARSVDGTVLRSKLAVAGRSMEKPLGSFNGRAFLGATSIEKRLFMYRAFSRIAYELVDLINNPDDLKKQVAGFGGDYSAFTNNFIRSRLPFDLYAKDLQRLGKKQ
jgi:hypothetical protein